MGVAGWLEPNEEAIFRAYARSARRIFSALDRDLQRDAGMNRVAFEVLWLLGSQDEAAPLRMGEMATRLAVPPSRVTQAVDALARDGWVTRQQSPADARVGHAVITDVGRTALARAAGTYASSIRCHLLEPLSSEQRGQLKQIGEELLRALSGEAATPRATAHGAGVSVDRLELGAHRYHGLRRS